MIEIQHMLSDMHGNLLYIYLFQNKMSASTSTWNPTKEKQSMRLVHKLEEA